MGDGRGPGGLGARGVIGIESRTISLDERREHIRAITTAHADTIAAFHKVWYDAPTWSMTQWMGVPVLKNPFDLMTLQRFIHMMKPSLIIETGTAYGGSALFMAHLCDHLGQGEIITIDLEPGIDVPQHPRIRYVRGSSIDPTVVNYVRQLAWRAQTRGPIIVLLDSDHHEPHVTAELNAYAPMVTPGSLLVVEDTNINGHPVLPEWGPGPAEALEMFLVEHPEFEREILAEQYLLTMHPGGWLRRRT